jgi:hypothetical protein
MVTERKVREFINSDLYNSLLGQLCEIRSVAINDDEPSSVILNHDVNKLNLSGFSLAEISDILEGDVTKFIIYVCLKFDVFLTAKDEQEGNDDEDEIVKVLPFYRNFLILYAIEFCFLEVNVSGLDDYLKKIRIPNAIKYAKELKSIYRRL